MAKKILPATVLVALMLAAPALASTSRVGKNIGDEIKSWAVTLLLGVAAIVALPILGKRDVHGGFVLAILVVLVGGFAFAPNEVKHAIESIWHSIAG